MSLVQVAMSLFQYPHELMRALKERHTLTYHVSHSLFTGENGLRN